jgi:L-cysteine desulfidase
MILQYPHLKHKMPVGLCNTQMLGIKYACSMKKMMKIKNRKLEEIK